MKIITIYIYLMAAGYVNINLPHILEFVLLQPLSSQ